LEKKKIAWFSGIQFSVRRLEDGIFEEFPDFGKVEAIEQINGVDSIMRNSVEFKVFREFDNGI
jgi:hypothetical protein